MTEETTTGAASRDPAPAASAFLVSVLDCVAQPVWVVDRDGLIWFANPSAVATLGYDDPSELLGKPSHQTIHYKHPDGSPFPAEECPMLLPRTTGETVHRTDDWFVRRDGSMLPVEYWSAPIGMSGGRGAVVAFTDLTMRLAAAQAARERDIAEARAAELSASEARQRAMLDVARRTERELASARTDLKLVADEQAALRRVATLVARGAATEDVFAVVAREVAGCLGVPLISIVRFDAGGTATHVGVWGHQNPFPVGTSWRLDKHGASGRVYHSSRPARVEYAHVSGEIAAKLAHDAGIRSAVAVPIVVNSRLWGAMMALSTEQDPQPADTEARLARFTELVATAIANTDARQELQQLADEQAALRSIATLVAGGAEPRTVFDAVCEATGRLTGAASVNLAHFTPDEYNLTMAGWSLHGTHVPAGTRLPLVGDSINVLVRRTRAPGRVDSYEGAPGPLAARLRELGIRSEVGAPVIVDGHVWGALIVGTDSPEPLPLGAEQRVASFTELIATAIANAEARRELQQLADEQAALRQVATLVAQGAEPRAIFDAVCEVTGRLTGAASVNLAHFTPDGFNVTVAGWSQHGNHVPPGTCLPLERGLVGMLMKQTRAPSRVDNYDHVPGQVAARVRALGIRSGVGAPVIVDGNVWGVLLAGTDSPEPLPAGTELRVASFAELIGIAVSNATARSELIESRARMITTFDAARRRVTRDLHDGAQQRFVSAIINLQLAQQKWSSAPQQAKQLLDHALRDASSGMQELREIAAGIHPAILTHRGLAAALDGLAARLPIPVELDVPSMRLPAAIESSIYFFCSEALTNVVKHARAGSAWVRVALEGDRYTVEVRDDGIGGAEPRPDSSGLIGLRDRIGALGGALEISSPAGAGTILRAWIPPPPEPARTEPAAEA
jgi:PAS domain S-box-containing protein